MCLLLVSEEYCSVFQTEQFTKSSKGVNSSKKVFKHFIPFTAIHVIGDWFEHFEDLYAILLGLLLFLFIINLSRHGNIMWDGEPEKRETETGRLRTQGGWGPWNPGGLAPLILSGPVTPLLPSSHIEIHDVRFG